MHHWIRYMLLALILLTLAAAGVIFLGFPRLEKATPADGAGDISLNEPLRLEFSRPMDPATVRLQITPEVPGTYQWEEQALVFTPSTAWPSGASIQVSLEAGARASAFPALPLRQAVHWSFAVWQPRLLFLYPSDGPANLFLYEPRTGEQVALTNVLDGVLDYDLHPNGQSLYYTTPLSQGGSQILRLPIEARQPLEAVATPAAGAGQAPEAATPTPLVRAQPQPVFTCQQANCRALAISPHGDYLAYERTALPGGSGSSQPQVWYLALDPSSGSALGDPLLAGQPDHQTLQPVWSPDSRLTFYDTTQAAFYVLNPANGQAVQFANQTGEPGAWRPDGSAFVAPEIFFLTPSAAGVTGLERLADSHLLLYDPRSGQNQDLTKDDGIEDAVPAFSPNGVYLAFARKYLDTSRWTPGRQLWLLDLQTNKARQLTADALYNHYDFAWSPSSDRLAFVRFNQSKLNEPPEVWMVDLVSGEFTRIISSGYAPRWLP